MPLAKIDAARLGIPANEWVQSGPAVDALNASRVANTAAIDRQ